MRSPERANRLNEAKRRKRREDLEWADRVRRQSREWRERNADKCRQLRRGYWAGAPIHRRLRCYFTSAICHSLNGSTKGGRSWQDILGYTAHELKAHLERQFTKGMSWDNYGEWHVDHIVPVAAFDYTSADDDGFMACWALTNLRPLWAKDNLTKRHKRTHLL